jgi:hypothetical protein
MPASWSINQWLFLHLKLKKNWRHCGYISCIHFIICAIGSNSMEANSYIPLDIKTVKTVILMLIKSVLYKYKTSLHSHTGNVGFVSPYDQGISSPNLLLWTAFLAA